MEFRRVFIYAVLAILAACGGGGSPAPEPPPPEEPPKTYTVDLQWDPPLTYEDGSTIEYLKEYRVYYGEDPNYLKQSKVLVIPGGVITFASLYVPKGVWYFGVTAIADNNLESDLSNIVTYSFN